MTERESEIDSLRVDLTKNTRHVEKIDINRSLSSLATTAISLDHILRKCGDLGRFQLIHFFFINLIAMSAGIVSFYYVFAAAEPNHRCRLPSNLWPNDISYHPINQTHQFYINSYIPYTKDENKWDSCRQYSIENLSNASISCSNGWVYDRSTFGYTFTEEANFVCQHVSKKSWLATVMQCGGFSLLIIGSLGDRYGRKRITTIVTLFLFSVCLVSQIIMQWSPLTLQTKFALLLINQFASGLAMSTYSLVFILMLELTSSAQTSFTGNLAFISFTVGEVFVTIFAYATRDWQKLKWADTIFIGLGIPYLYFMPESPLYYYSKGKYRQLESVLRRIAKQNGRHETDWYSSYQELIKHQSIKITSHRKATCSQKLFRLLRHRRTIVRLIISALVGFTTLMLYIKISYGLALNVSPYLGILIGALVEAMSYITSSVLMSSRLGRKGSFIILMILTIICILTLPTVEKYSAIGNMCVAQFGKYTISGAIAISWIFVPEQFPTSIRSSAIGFFVAFSRIGAIMAPIINTSINKDYLPYTYYGFAILAFLILLLSLLLPETKDKPMDEVHDYLSNISDM